MSDQPPVPPTEPTPPVGPPPAGGANWQGVQPVVERPTEAMSPVPPPEPPPAPPPAPPQGPTGQPGPPAGGGGSNKGLVTAIVVVLVAILGVGGFLLLGGDDGDDDARTPIERDDDDREDDGDDEETTTTAAPDETTTTTEAPEETTTTVPPDGGAPTGFTQVSDDTGRLVVQVPDTWTDVDGRPLSENELNVQASPDLEAFRSFQASGVSFSLLGQQNADPDVTLDFLMSGQTDRCELGPRTDYSDGVFTGRQQNLLNCDGAGITLLIIVASNAAGDSVEVSTIIVPPDEVGPIHGQIVASFNVLS
jgi:hypothetical protein